MNFPNLVWAIRNRRLNQYEIGSKVGMSPAGFSRALNGRGEFAPHERTRIAEMLGFSEVWLFQEVMAPPPFRSKAAGDVELVVV